MPSLAGPEPHKLVQPRDHKANVSIWADLTVNDLDVLDEVADVGDMKDMLAQLFNLVDYKENMKHGILVDLYFYTIQFSRENKFSKEQTSAFFSIVKKLHEICTETPFGNVDHCFRYFREAILRHAVKRPPFSIELFSPDEVRVISDYVMNTYFRHFKMYKYVFTPLVRLDLSMSYVGVPVTPSPSEAGDAEDQTADTEGQDAAEDKEGADTEGEKEEEKEESPAAKELRQLIHKHLSEELKKLKITVDEQLKTTEEVMNKKLASVEGTPGKSGRASSRGKKNK
ncbi:unnamed protein product [Owenia fusiformis]|uniref:Uncharacterized protein n=1 Tax=Owenia fusiformis TaxID=6347 RepID=A0A8J1XP70_OWEFU|nr:unnamed protein product [Owenia fusiformis]